METLFELLFQLLAELVLQIAFELAVELGLRSIAEPFRPKPNPLLATLGYAILGGVAGALSLFMFPTRMITSSFGGLVGLGLTPVLAGCAMAALGAWRRRRDQQLIRIDRFFYGYLFALAMALVRFHFGR